MSNYNVQYSENVVEFRDCDGEERWRTQGGMSGVIRMSESIRGPGQRLSATNGPFMKILQARVP